jgi:hypothetical protein
MIGKPEIVVVQKRDQWRARFSNTNVIRSSLLPPISVQVDEAYAWILSARDNLSCIVGASVTDNNHLPIGKGLAAGALNCARQCPAAIVSRGYDSNSRRLCPDGHFRFVRDIS